MFADNLKSFLKEKRMKQKELAAMLFTSPSNLTKMIKANKIPNDDVLLKLVEIFDCDLSDLVTERELNEKNGGVKRVSFAEREDFGKWLDKMCKKLSALTESQKQLIICDLKRVLSNWGVNV